MIFVTKKYFDTRAKLGVMLGIFALGITSTALLAISLKADAALSQVPLNGKIIFASNRSGNYEVYTMNADGTSQINITNSGSIDFWPTWSTDGTKVSFSTNRDGNYEIYTANADGSNLVRLTNNSSVDNTPVWSPDGTKIAFMTGRDGNNEIYTMNPDGSNQTRLTNNSATDGNPTWSPDSTKIAFTTTRDGGANEIYTMNADGSSPVRLTNNATFDYYPAWSPDGTKIAYSSYQVDNDEIYVMNADGSNQTRLTNVSGNDYYPNWSPDGAKIVFNSNRVGNYEIYTMNPDGTSQTRHTTAGTVSYQPSWQKILTPPCSVTDGIRTCTVSDDDDLSSHDFSVGEDEVLEVAGSVGDITVESGGILKGTGNTATISVESGGHVTPGTSPGCLSSGNTSFASGSFFDVEIASTTACTEYDQLEVTGTVDLGGAALSTTLLSGFTPALTTVFTIIDNDDTDAIAGTFAGLPEGTVFVVDSTYFQITYVGGSGNDVTLTATTAPVNAPTTDSNSGDDTEAAKPSSLPGVPSTGFQRNQHLSPLALLGISLLCGAITLVIVHHQTSKTKIS